jgi:hypothetical protein
MLSVRSRAYSRTPNNYSFCTPYRNNIMTTTNLYIVAEPLQADQGLKERPRVATGQQSFAESKVETEPEKRLWKVCAKAASPRVSGLEWLAFLLLEFRRLGR